MLSSTKKLFVLILIVGYANSGQASIFGWHLGNFGKRDTNSEYHKRLPLIFNDDLTKDQIGQKVQLTATQKHQAQVWGLSEQQEQRYVFLMQNRSGIYFKNTKLTPVEILGINARDDAERSQYAALDISQEFEKNAKLLAFNAAYTKAAFALKTKLKLPIIHKFNYSKYSPYNYTPVKLEKDDKLMLFITKAEDVKPIIGYLMPEMERLGAQLNIYFVDSAIAQADIINWAQAQNIPPNMVNDRLITLNFDHGQYAKVNAVDKKTPLLVLVRDGTSRIVDMGRF